MSVYWKLHFLSPPACEGIAMPRTWTRIVRSHSIPEPWFRPAVQPLSVLSDTVTEAVCFLRCFMIGDLVQHQGDNSPHSAPRPLRQGSEALRAELRHNSKPARCGSTCGLCLRSNRLPSGQAVLNNLKLDCEVFRS